MRLLVCAAALAVSLAAAPKTEIGEINGAQFRIDVPEAWNGGLILYCHGYSAVPGTFDPAKPNPAAGLFTGQGFAVAQSGYAAGGWAIEEALQDTQALRRYFVRKYGAPKETWVSGHSMGGFLTMAMLEKYPNDVDGGLALCGPLGPASWFMLRRVFDMRVVFDHYFPGVLPPPDRVPADYAMSPARNQKVREILDGNAEAAAAFRRYSGIQNNKEAAATVVFFTYILKDLQQRGGGNPFDNRDTIYDGSPDDNALNDGVKRYRAVPRAAEYVRTWYTPTGRLTRPMLAIHTTYDPLVPPWVPNYYAHLAEESGLFVQQYVKRAGHCAIQPQEVARGLAQLREWKATGKRPE
ncbi:MAG: alpha/beta hydrolase [Bryobacteraceae bacterium]